MIVFIYSEQVNKNLMDNFWNPEQVKFMREHNIVYFEPSEENTKKVEEIVARGFPQIEGDITCYIRTFGCWGMYHKQDNCISICPIGIDKAPGGLVGVVEHEASHLQHPEADTMEHEDKERYVESYTRKK